MLTERQILGTLTVLEDGQIQVRTDTVIERDGVEITRTYHRHVVEPDMEPDKFSPRLKAICLALWTPNVVTAYRVQKHQQSERRP